jgi:single-strand DNA-binding protein
MTHHLWRCSVPSVVDSPFNLAVLVGRLSREPTEVQLPSGDRLVRFEVTVARADGPADSVPVSWLAAPARALGFAAGDQVAVVGTVRRRFFRSGGRLDSRTEVAANALVAVSHRAAARAVEQAGAALAELVSALPAGSR